MRVPGKFWSSFVWSGWFRQSRAPNFRETSSPPNTVYRFTWGLWERTIRWETPERLDRRNIVTGAFSFHPA
ncbi:hypothetical protein RvY_19124-1 [Ramazzottius varieornatus]|uniref:Uncharacterized protein n=1 Tax=Ramazzottius varieornatus TaxID=947166 RepID=A0A1D1WC31_RAMVA|nr:hypothetical protein RvY_19124-1 [Ramazzottius varieornatus]